MKKLLLIIIFCFIFLPYGWCADRYWVGGGSSTNWNATGDTNWAASSGGAGNQSVPGTSDDVFFDANSGAGTCVVNLNPVRCLSLDATGFTGQIYMNSGTNISCGGNFTLDAGMTFNTSTSATRSLTIIGNSNITCAGKNLPNLKIQTAGITVTLLDSFQQNATYRFYISHTKGTFDTNDQSVSTAVFSGTGSDARTLTLGTSTITCTWTNEATWSFGTVTNLTLNENTSTIVLSGSGGDFAGGGETYYNLQLTGAGNQYVSGANTFTNLTRTGTASKTDSLNLYANQTISGTLTVNGNSATNRMLVYSSDLGTARTLTTAATSIDNADFRDITGAGVAGWDLSGESTGDCGGNTDITFTTADTMYWHVGAGAWSDSGQWFLATNGGGGAGRVPLPQDDAVFDANSFDNHQHVSTAMPRLGKNIDWSACDDTPQWDIDTTVTIYGSLDLTNMLHDFDVGVRFEGRGAHNITSNGSTWGINAPSGIYSVGGSYTLLSAVAFQQGGSSRTWGVYNGTFDANDFNVTMGIFSSNVSTTRSILMGNGTWTIENSNSQWIWNIATTTNLTFDAEGSTLFFGNNDARGTDEFTGGGLTYNDIEFESATGGSSITKVFGSNTFNTLTIQKPKTIQFDNGTTQTVSSFVAAGDAVDGITISSDTTAAHTLTDTGGTNAVEYCTISYSEAGGGATWNATSSTDGGNNTGWIFVTAGMTMQPIINIF